MRVGSLIISTDKERVRMPFSDSCGIIIGLLESNYIRVRTLRGWIIDLNGLKCKELA